MAQITTKEFMDRMHPAYTARQAIYRFLADAYEGGAGYLSRNLFMHSPRETRVDFDRRLEQAVYPNFVRAVLKTYRDHVFKRGEGVSRDIEDDTYAAYLENVDRSGHDANWFWGRVGMREMLYGWMGILVDMPRTPDVGRDLTRADAASLGMTPYLVDFPPSAIVDWSLDDFGQFNWVHLKTEVINDVDPFSRRERSELHQLWTTTGWARYDDDGRLLDEGEHGLGVVPFVVVRFEDSEVYDLIGTSFMEDFARMNRSITNSMSLRHDFLAKNALQILTMQLVATMSDDGNNTDQVVIRNLLEYASGLGGETVHPPAFIGPDVSGAEWMFRHVEDLREHMYFMAMLQNVEAKAGDVTSESGVAKLVDFEQTSAALASFADGLEQAELATARLWYAWQDQQWNEEWVVDYPDTFNIQAISQELADAVVVRDVFGDATPTFVARYLEALAGRIMEDLPEEDATRIAQELSDNLDNLTQEAVFPGRVAGESMMPPNGGELPI